MESNLEQSGVDIGESPDIEEKILSGNSSMEENSTETNSSGEIPNEEIPNEEVLDKGV